MLQVADAVSFEFDGINATAQHVMARPVPLMRLLAFYDQFIKDYRSSQVSAHWCFLWEDMWARSGIQTADDRLLPQLAVKQRDRRRYWWRHVHSWCGEQSSHSVTPRWYSFIIRHIALYTLKTTREILNIQLEHWADCKIKYKYQGTLKLKVGLWPNWTRPDPTRPFM